VPFSPTASAPGVSVVLWPGGSATLSSGLRFASGHGASVLASGEAVTRASVFVPASQPSVGSTNTELPAPPLNPGAATDVHAPW